MTHQTHPTRLLRDAANTRQTGICLWCNNSLNPNTAHLHHRQRRRNLGWCSCNTILLHPECHSLGHNTVHNNPTQARTMGLIVPTWDDPTTTPITLPFYGPATLHCDTTWTPHNTP